MYSFERWYDKDEDLVLFFSFLENLDDRKKEFLAKEILLIIFTEFSFNYDEKVRSLSNLKYEQNKRWYDKNVNVQSAIELLKTLSISQRKEVMIRIVETIQQLILMGE